MKKLYPFLSLIALAIILISFTAFKGNEKTSSLKGSEELVADWERAKAYTKEYLDAASENTIGYKPTPEMRSFAEQMLHLTQGNINIVASSTGKAKIYDGKQLEKMDEYKTKEALTNVVMEGYDFVIAAIKEVPADKWNEKVTIFRWEMTRAEGVAKAFEHQTHHRGQTTVYLRMSGVTPPNEKLF